MPTIQPTDSSAIDQRPLLQQQRSSYSDSDAPRPKLHVSLMLIMGVEDDVSSYGAPCLHLAYLCQNYCNSTTNAVGVVEPFQIPKNKTEKGE